MYVGRKDPRRDTITLTGHSHISLNDFLVASPGDIATDFGRREFDSVVLDAPAGLRTARDLPIGFFSP